MDKKDFAENTRYAVTLREEETGKLRPANIYVYRLYDEFMIARMTDREGYLRKIAYENVAKIVRVIPVEKGIQFRVPEALLAKDAWKGRTRMTLYSSAPSLGK